MKNIIISCLAVSLLTTIGIADTHAADNRIAAAITQQINSFNKKSGQIDTTVELVTVSRYPARLALKGLSTPRNITYLGLEKETDFNKACHSKTPSGKKCKQRFTFKLDANKACRLNGNYKAQFMVSCVEGKPKGRCKSGTHNVNFKLQSENFCDEKTTTIEKK